MKVQRVLQGRGKLEKLPDLMEKCGINRPLIVGGKTLIARLLRKNPSLLSAPVFSGYHANPDATDAKHGAELFRKENCDGLISIGGGSAMDTAKTVKALLAAGGKETLPDLTALAAGEMKTPHIAISGTAGTGAEATQFAVMYLEGVKKSLSHPDLLPEGALLDADLLDSLPDYHRKSCAMDALSQGIESYWSAGADDDSRVHAFLAILGVLDNLTAYLKGDPHAAEEMLDASYQSGKAIQITRTTAAHAMSYQITKLLGPAHGHACMLTLPYLWEAMIGREDCKERLRDLAEKMRLGDVTMGPRLLKGILYTLELEIPRMPDTETMDRLVSSVDPERLGNHPMPLSREEIRKIYTQAFTKVREPELQACLDIWKYYGRQ